MRFGIMSSQIQMLLPADFDNENFMQRILDYKHSELVRRIANSGFNQIELSGDLGILLPHFYTHESIKELNDLRLELNLAFTVHLPLWSIEPSTLLSSVRGGSVQALINHIKMVESLEPEYYVLHGTGALAAEFYRMDLPEQAKGFILSQFKEKAIESIAAILKQTGIPRKALAIETIEFPFDLTIDLVDEMDLSICFDTGHILAGFCGPVDFFDALQRCLPNLAEIHLHDSPSYIKGKKIKYGVDHQQLGKGDLEIEKFFKILGKNRFNGPVIFELTLDEAIKSIQLIKEIRPKVI